MSASATMRSNSEATRPSSAVVRAKSTNSAWMSCGGIAVPIRLSQAWVTAGTLRWFDQQTPVAVGLFPVGRAGLVGAGLHECRGPAGLPQRYGKAAGLCRAVPLAQELEELDALPQPPPHHLRTAHHLADDGRDLRGAEIEPLVESLDVVEHFRVRQMRIGQRCDL